MSDFNPEIFNSAEWMQEVLDAGNTGLWIIRIDPATDHKQMLANTTMLGLLGLRTHPSPEYCYEHWYTRIPQEYLPQVNDMVNRMLITSMHQEVQYPWLHPDCGYIFVRCGGKLNNKKPSPDGMVQFMGYHQDITELENMRKKLQVSQTKLEDINRMSNELLRLNAQYKEMAYIDMLTGLPNRRSFFEQGRIAVHTLREHDSACVIMADIDHFKNINDTYTHPRGDEVLKEVGKRLQATLRQNEICGRIGGEEFAIFLPNINLENAGHVAERIRTYCAQSPVSTLAGPIKVTVSFGVAQVNPTSHDALQDALQRSDNALYRAKRGGRNRVCLDEPDPKKIITQA